VASDFNGLAEHENSGWRKMMANEQSKRMGVVIHKAWTDEAFRKRLLSDTMNVLKETGVKVREGVTVKVVENTGTVSHLVIPAKPSPEFALSRVAGQIALQCPNCCPFSGDAEQPCDCDVCECE
jgi:hypothetical protein